MLSGLVWPRREGHHDDSPRDGAQPGEVLRRARAER